VKLIHHFDVENNSESEHQLKIQSEIEEPMNLKHPDVAGPFGFVVSSNCTELKVVRAYPRIGSLKTVLQTAPSWWTMTAKSIAITGIVLGMRFVHRFGLSCKDLKPRNILFNEAHQIQIMDIVPTQTKSHCRDPFDGSRWKTEGASSEFAAPESSSDYKLTQMAHVFACASVLFSIVVGQRPFEEIDERGGRAEIGLIVRDAIPGFVSRVVSRLILSGLSTNPNARPSFNEILDVLKQNDFRITEEVDSKAVWARVDSVESSEF
jgi:serine/threonine protein kinase